MDGVLIRPHLDSNGRDLAIEHVQDVEPILEWNRQARRDEQRSDWGRHVARIPNVIYVKWLNEEHARGNTSLADVHARVRPDRAEEARRSRMGLFANRQAETAGRLVSGAIVTQIVDYASLQTAVTEYLAQGSGRDADCADPDLHPARGSEIQPATVRAPDGAARNRAGRYRLERAGIHLAAGGFPVDAPGSAVERDRQAAVSSSSPARRSTNIGSASPTSPAQPRYFTVFGDEIEFAPTPDAAYTIEMVYRQNIPPLAANDQQLAADAGARSLSVRRAAGIGAVHQGRRPDPDLGSWLHHGAERSEQSRADIDVQRRADDGPRLRPGYSKEIYADGIVQQIQLLCAGRGERAA